MKTDWVSCPICSQPDMRKETDADGNALIFCVNHECQSNGGKFAADGRRSRHVKPTHQCPTAGECWVKTADAIMNPQKCAFVFAFDPHDEFFGMTESQWDSLHGKNVKVTL